MNYIFDLKYLGYLYTSYILHIKKNQNKKIYFYFYNSFII